jgi:hypothetical protein
MLMTESPFFVFDLNPLNTLVVHEFGEEVVVLPLVKRSVFPREKHCP